MSLKSRPEVVLVAALAAAVLIPDGLISRGLPTGWGNFHLVRVAAACTGLAIAAWLLTGRDLFSKFAPGTSDGLLVALLAAHVGFVTVLLGKYLVGAIPSTWSHDVIQYYAQSGSLIDMYRLESALSPPVTTPIYPPGMFAVVAILEPLLGEGPHVVRLVVTGSILVIAAAIGWLTAREQGRAWGWVAGGLFLAIFPQVVWSGAPTKPEYLAVALSMSGLAVLIDPAAASSESVKRLALGGFLFGAALLVKFTVVAGLAGVLLYKALVRRWKSLAVVGGTAGLVFGGTYLALSWATDGGLSFFTMAGNLAKPDLEKAFRFGFMGFGQSFFVVVALTLAIVRLFGSKGQGLTLLQGTVALATMMAVAMGIATTARPGSSANYFLEAVALGVLLIAIHLPAEGRSSRQSGWISVGALVTVFLAVHLPSQAALLARDPPDRHLSSEVLRRLDVERGEFVLSDPEFVQPLLDTGFEPLVVDSYQFTMMADGGLLSDSILTKPMREGKVPFVLLSESPARYEDDRFGRRTQTRGVLDMIERAYRCSPAGETGVITCRWSP